MSKQLKQISSFIRKKEEKVSPVKPVLLLNVDNKKVNIDNQKKIKQEKEEKIILTRLEEQSKMEDEKEKEKIEIYKKMEKERLEDQFKREKEREKNEKIRSQKEEEKRKEEEMQLRNEKRQEIEKREEEEKEKEKGKEKEKEKEEKEKEKEKGNTNRRIILNPKSLLIALDNMHEDYSQDQYGDKHYYENKEEEEQTSLFTHPELNKDSPGMANWMAPLDREEVPSCSILNINPNEEVMDSFHEKEDEFYEVPDEDEAYLEYMKDQEEEESDDRNCLPEEPISINFYHNEFGLLSTIFNDLLSAFVKAVNTLDENRVLDICPFDGGVIISATERVYVEGYEADPYQPTEDFFYKESSDCKNSAQKGNFMKEKGNLLLMKNSDAYKSSCSNKEQDEEEKLISKRKEESYLALQSAIKESMGDKKTFEKKPLNPVTSSEFYPKGYEDKNKSQKEEKEKEKLEVKKEKEQLSSLISDLKFSFPYISSTRKIRETSLKLEGVTIEELDRYINSSKRSGEYDLDGNMTFIQMWKLKCIKPDSTFFKLISKVEYSWLFKS